MSIRVNRLNQMKKHEVNIYETNHEISKKICREIAQGTPSRLLPVDLYIPGHSMVYGILRGTVPIMEQTQAAGYNYYHIDHGYFQSRYKVGWDRGYYRITKNGHQARPSEFWQNNAFPSDRRNRLNINFKSWRKDGRNIVVIPLSKFVGQYMGVSPHKWLQKTLRQLANNTDRNIIIKPKDEDQPLEEVLKDAYAVVAFNSNAAIDALVEGIPAFVTGPSAAEPVSLFDLTQIEHPYYPDFRKEWANWLSYRQFTFEEMRNGTAWQHIKEYY